MTMLAYILAITLCLSIGNTLPTDQVPILFEPLDQAPDSELALSSGSRALNGRFLHITGATP